MIKSYYFITAIILAALFSCSNNTPKNGSQKTTDYLDSIRTADKINQETMQKEDSMAVYAWGDAKFGMTLNETLKTDAFSSADRYDNSLTLNLDNTIALSKSMGLHMWPGVWADFEGTDKELSLVRVSINYDSQYATYFAEDLNKIVNEFKSKYGEPERLNNNYKTISVSDIKYGDDIEIAFWMIGSGRGENGTKFITIKAIKEMPTVSHHTIDIKITNTDFPKNKKENTTSKDNTVRQSF